MTRTSKALRRLGVSGLAAATVLSVAPLLGATAAFAAGTPLLVADDCTQQSTATTTTTQANTRPTVAGTATTPAAPSSNASGAGSGCTTQAQVNTNKTLTFTYTEGGAPVSGRSIDFTIADPNTPGYPAYTAQPSGSFSASQPSGSSSGTGPLPGQYAGQAAQCTTDAAGKCSINVTDSNAETITVNGTERASGAKADEDIQFRPNPTNVTRLDENSRLDVSPDGVTKTPGRPVQLTYTAYDANGGCGTASAPAGSATCTGAIVRSQSISLSVNSAAFFTPSCTPRDLSGAPQRNTTPATTTVASTGTLANPVYGACSFTGTPVNDGNTTALTSNGQTITVVTDQAGQFTVTVAEARDAAFDDDGYVDVAVTATPAGGTAVTARQTGTDSSATGAGCDTLSNGVTTDGSPSLASQQGCAVVPIEFTTRVKALTGSSFSIDPISGPAYGASNPTPDNPGTQAAIFVVHLKDQYGNLTLSSMGAPNSNDYATLSRTGAGVLRYCGTGNATTANPCPSNTTPGSTSNPDGTTSQLVVVRGSFTNVNQQERFSPRPDTDINGDPVDGTVTVSGKWVAPITEFIVGTTNDPTTGTKVSGFDQTETDNVFTQVVAFSFYKQQAKSITFKMTPGNSVPVGTVVTVQATVLDQFGRPLQGYFLNFFRGGSSNNCTDTAQNGTGQGGTGRNTDNAGTASYSFSCAEASTQNITAVVYDFTTGGGQGGELGRNTASVIFTGATVQPTSSATPTATASPTAGGKGQLSTSTPDIQPNIQGVLTATNLTPNAVYELRCYSRPSTTYFTARSASTSAGSTTLEFRILPGTNTRCYVRPEGNEALASNSVVINVHTTLSLSTVRTGVRTYIFQGRNLPRRAGQLITLYRVANGQEIRTSNLKTDASGIYRVTRKFTGTGTFQFRVRTSQTLTNAPGVSNVITVNVH